MVTIECPIGHKRIEQSNVEDGCPYCALGNSKEDLGKAKELILMLELRVRELETNNIDT